MLRFVMRILFGCRIVWTLSHADGEQKVRITLRSRDPKSIANYIASIEKTEIAPLLANGWDLTSKEER